MKVDGTILDACTAEHAFARWFKDRDTWQAWFAFLAALFGLPMSEEQAAIYRAQTGRSALPEAPFSEGWLVCGRRSGKSFIMALVAVFLACFRDYRPHLAPGERATVLVIAADRRQARVIMRYVRALLLDVPMLARLVERENTESFDLSNRVSIEVATASFKTVRGYTLCAALCDELAFWATDDAASPDYAVLDALRPAMATIPNAMLLCGSSPYARRGALWDAYRRHYGQDGAPLVWQAATATMNATVPEGLISEAYERDPEWASAEYGAEFRTDLEVLFTREQLEACVESGAAEGRPFPGTRFTAFADMSGGASDSAALAIAHKDGDAVVLDLAREWRAPHSPQDVAEEMAKVLREFRLSRVWGDRYAGEWPVEQFRQLGIRYVHSEKTKSELYGEFVPLITTQRAYLYPHERLFHQLLLLERRTGRGSGRDRIDHRPGGKDDVANAAAGAMVMSRMASSALDVEERRRRAMLAPKQANSGFSRGHGPLRGWINA